MALLKTVSLHFVVDYGSFIEGLIKYANDEDGWTRQAKRDCIYTIDWLDEGMTSNENAWITCKRIVGDFAAFMLEFAAPVQLQDVLACVQTNLLTANRHAAPYDLRLNVLPYASVVAITREEFAKGTWPERISGTLSRDGAYRYDQAVYTNERRVVE